MEHKAVAKSLRELAGAIERLAKIAEGDSASQLEVLTKARKIVASMDWARLSSQVNERHEAAAGQVDVAIRTRRESLLAAARAAGLPHKRLDASDRVGIFKVEYSGKQITLKLGSEKLPSFEEADGARVLERIQSEEATLRQTALPRDTFFKMLQSAHRHAVDAGCGRDGKVGVDRLYPFVVTARQEQSDEFRRHPDAKHFIPYSRCQFLFDLATFGAREWSLGGLQVRTHTPNMSSVDKGQSMTLPVLDGSDRSGTQIGAIWFEKHEA